MRFGTRQCGNMVYYQIEFVGVDGKKHVLERRIAAPIDRIQHTYRLNWKASEDAFEIV